LLITASAFAAVLPMFSYLLIIWWIDRYEREPFRLVLKNYLWGAIGAIIFAAAWSSIVSAFISIFIKETTQLQKLETIVVAPFVEEITKGAFLLFTIRSNKFDNITDGIVYGGAIGLGFGMTENFLYFILYGNTLVNWITIVIIRTLFSAVMHCVATATFGAFLAYSKYKKTLVKISSIFTGFLVAMFIHLAWNFSVSFESTTLLGFLFMIFTIVIFMLTFSISIISEKKIIYKELLGEAENGLIPYTHLSILNSSIRNKFGWVDESIRKSYINAATTLAFRKRQLRNSSGNSKSYYEEDINYYRNFIQNLLSNTENK